MIIFINQYSKSRQFFNIIGLVKLRVKSPSSLLYYCNHTIFISYSLSMICLFKILLLSYLLYHLSHIYFLVRIACIFVIFKFMIWYIFFVFVYTAIITSAEQRRLCFYDCWLFAWDFFTNAWTDFHEMCRIDPASNIIILDHFRVDSLTPG